MPNVLTEAEHSQRTDLRRATKATTIVPARCSVPERVQSAAPTVSTAERGSVCFAVGSGGLREFSHPGHSILGNCPFAILMGR
jgi:hypothetical protein